MLLNLSPFNNQVPCQIFRVYTFHVFEFKPIHQIFLVSPLDSLFTFCSTNSAKLLIKHSTYEFLQVNLLTYKALENQSFLGFLKLKISNKIICSYIISPNIICYKILILPKLQQKSVKHCQIWMIADASTYRIGKIMNYEIKNSKK